MSRSRTIPALFFLVLIALYAPAADKLSSKIDRVLSAPDVSRAFWGIEIVSLDNGKTLYSRNSDKLFTPASNTKLFTTSTAFALLGPDFRFHTTVETSGTVDKRGRLDSDLVIVGRGDPNLSGRTLPYNLRTERKQPPIAALENLADQLVQKGVRYVDGDIVADDSYYAFERYGEGWAQDDLVWEWGAPVSALTVNDNVIFVSIQPADRVGERAFVDITPFPAYYRVDNRVMTTPQGTGPRKIYINREPGSNQLTLWGNIPVDDQGANEALAIEDPADFTAKLFRELLDKRGVTVYGRPKTKHTELASLSTFSITATASAGGGADRAPAPVSRLPLVLGQYDSQPLSADLKVINKVSQNLHAELLLRLLGKEKGTAGTIEGGLEVERAFLASADIRPEEYTLYDGSGLSRQDLATPHAFVKLLTYAHKQPWGATFEDTLPVAGVDGSLVERFTKSTAQSRVHAKTGSLDHVNSLSGYLTTEKGEHVVFSILSNNHNLTNKHAIETIDAIVQAVVDSGKK
ncbi:D-Ala-D-Ala carboxypeptidase [Candidatus Koribacter versatilis Ellin345]|uniref:D-Ala-D-Ala carboxypeptidase n=1 Tax=Koribacter versatilis (strain Ellin345) TaxID=204669 RepID=Q1II05_KORVE|nr:D-alanyl-D-alanine carboxypeptidase/D-alanyl-D-alanine-endopeptidase [Candidatus Koribacter versatilis]ABF43495.1 D-Ala-D-Ala carboxypeptidase [Candidatus Koribacter versatilis Ellin345]